MFSNLLKFECDTPGDDSLSKPYVVTDGESVDHSIVFQITSGLGSKGHFECALPCHRYACGEATFVSGM
jgi:hypothetical protein